VKHLVPVIALSGFKILRVTQMSNLKEAMIQSETSFSHISIKYDFFANI
jgi:hypothetical protein